MSVSEDPETSELIGLIGGATVASSSQDGGFANGAHPLPEQSQAVAPLTLPGRIHRSLHGAGRRPRPLRILRHAARKVAPREPEGGPVAHWPLHFRKLGAWTWTRPRAVCELRHRDTRNYILPRYCLIDQDDQGVARWLRKDLLLVDSLLKVNIFLNTCLLHKLQKL